MSVKQNAYATIKGFEVMRALKKRQADSFNFTGDIQGEIRIIERAFGLWKLCYGRYDEHTPNPLKGGIICHQ